MPFGQSWAARQGTRVVASALGAPPIVEEVASRAVGWTVAHLTLDHHHQVLAEFADHPATQSIANNAAQAVLDQCGDQDGHAGISDVIVASQRGAEAVADRLNL